MTIVGFTGTRHGMTVEQQRTVRRLLSEIADAIELHHGDCVGADADAHAIARRLPVEAIVVHPPINDRARAFCAADTTMPPAPYLERDRAIVDACDRLIATPSGRLEELRSGTWATVRMARAFGKPVTIVYPQGDTRDVP